MQHVAVRLSNLLPVEPQPAQPGPVTSGMDDNPHGFNTTNLHVHGLHVAPLEDNVFLELQPLANGPTAVCAPSTANPVWVCNGSYTYRYNFGRTPNNGRTQIPAGTYWYHPHKHGSVASQVASGMAGAFIVLGDLDEIPGVAGLPEKIMVAQMIPTATYGTETVGVVNPQFYYGVQPNPPQPIKVPNNPNQLISINGLVNPSLVMHYGEIQRWRFINATADQFFYLNVTASSGTTAPVPELYAIAVDGVPLTNSAQGIAVPFRVLPPQSLKSPRNFNDAVMNEIAILAPAQRLDLLVRLPPTAQAPAEAITYSFRPSRMIRRMPDRQTPRTSLRSSAFSIPPGIPSRINFPTRRASIPGRFTALLCRRMRPSGRKRRRRRYNSVSLATRSTAAIPARS